MEKATLVYSIFEEEIAASHAVELLLEAGFPRDSITLQDRDDDGADTAFVSDDFGEGGFLVGVTTDTRTQDAQSALLAAGAPSERIKAAGTDANGRRTRSDTLEDPVDEAGRESFPASDPPSWMPPGESEKDHH